MCINWVSGQIISLTKSSWEGRRKEGLGHWSNLYFYMKLALVSKHRANSHQADTVLKRPQLDLCVKPVEATSDKLWQILHAKVQLHSYLITLQTTKLGRAHCVPA